MNTVQQERIVQGHTTILHTLLDVTKLEQMIESLVEPLRNMQGQLQAQEGQWTANNDKLGTIASKQEELVNSLAAINVSIASLNSCIDAVRDDVGTLKLTIERVASGMYHPEASASRKYGLHTPGSATVFTSAGRENNSAGAFRPIPTPLGNPEERGRAGGIGQSEDGALHVAVQAEPAQTAKDINTTTRPLLHVLAGVLAIATLLGYLAYSAFANF